MSCQDSLCASCCFWQTFSNQPLPEGCICRSKILHRTEGKLHQCVSLFSCVWSFSGSRHLQVLRLLINRDHLMRPIEHNLLTNVSFSRTRTLRCVYLIHSVKLEQRKNRIPEQTKHNKKKKNVHAFLRRPSFEKRSSILEAHWTVKLLKCVYVRGHDKQTSTFTRHFCSQIQILECIQQSERTKTLRYIKNVENLS